MSKLFKKIILINIILFLIISNKISLAKDTTQQKKQNINSISRNTSEQLIINEIFPNPKGKDSGKEWLELYNSGKQNISLDSWEIKQIKLNSQKAKPKITLLSNGLMIEPKSHLILDNLYFKSLPNKQTRIELLNPDGKIIDSIHYEKTKENLSLSKISLINTLNKKIHSKYIWTTPTQNSTNSKFYLISGIIKKNGTSYFILENKSISSKSLKIFFPKNNSKNQINQLILKENQQIMTLVEKNNNRLILKTYQIKNPKNFNQENKIKKIDQILTKTFKIIIWTTLTGIIILILIKTFLQQNNKY